MTAKSLITLGLVLVSCLSLLAHSLRGATPPRATTNKPIRAVDQKSAEPMFEFTHVLASNSSFYRVVELKGDPDDAAPQKDQPADGRLRAGTRVRLVAHKNGFAEVVTDRGDKVLVPDSQLRESSEPREERLAQLVDGNNRFALDLYSQLQGEQDGNLFFSPYSISAALAMTYAGARGETAAQMRSTLHFDLASDQLPEAFQTLAEILQGGSSPGYQLTIANRLWGQQGHDFLPDYLGLTKTYFGAELGQLDFAQQTEAARQSINAWIGEQTHDKIRDLLTPGAVDPMTRLVLTNAIYFKGTWSDPFEKKATRDAPFFVTADRQAKVPMMHREDHFGYREQDGVQILQMQYGNDDLSMVVLLPEKRDGLADLEKQLTAEKLREWTSMLGRPEVNVFLPRFKLDSRFDLNQVLATLGMPLPFSNRADFSGISTSEQLLISAVIHQAVVEVNEEGTEAAAATAIVIAPTAMPNPARIPVFRADHPFMFLIRDNRTGEILFLGRMIDPAG